MADPSSFATPRPAPRAPGPRKGYRTTSQRLQTTVSDDSEEREYLSNLPPPPSGNWGQAPGSSYAESPLPLTAPTTATASQDFSRPPRSPLRPRYESTTQTLPSLYDPPTGAERFDGSQYGTIRYTGRSEDFSPTSRYPATERPDSEAVVGTALGSGRRSRDSLWGKRLSGGKVHTRGAPALPRGVSEESQVELR